MSVSLLYVYVMLSAPINLFAPYQPVCMSVSLMYVYVMLSAPINVNNLERLHVLEVGADGGEDEAGLEERVGHDVRVDPCARPFLCGGGVGVGEGICR